MKFALVLTTINVPEVLKLYRACAPEVRFFVIGDRKSDDAATQALIDTIPNSVCYGIDAQAKLGYGTNSMLPENCIQRRNLGFLEAVKWGAEAIVSIDDDNIPLDLSYFADMQTRLQWPFNGLGFSGEPDTWFDPGYLLEPHAKHRGLPYNAPRHGKMISTTKTRIGVAAGMCLGDPDIDAVTRIATRPIVGDTNAIGRAGIAVASHTWTVFNSQNTSILRELIPAWGMVPHCGRFDDIYASLIAQRVMRDRDMHVHFGKPFVWQSRNEHNLIKDLRGEIDGYDNIVTLASLLDQIILPNKSVIADCRIIWDAIKASGLMPFETVSAMYAYLADCEGLGL